MKKVDIILPTFNCEKYIEETLNSIINQSVKYWRLIIVDDSSQDNTVQIINKFLKDDRINLIKLKKNKGAGFCRNLAIRASNSKYVAFIDSDDIWKSEKLNKQINQMDNKNLDFTYTDYTPFKEKNGVKKMMKTITLPKSFNYISFIKKTSICTSSMIIKRTNIKLVKFLKTKICEDYYFKCQLLKNCNYAINIEENLTLYRLSPNSLQSQKMRNFYWVWHINKKYNKMSFIKNILSLISISLNSLKNYGLK
jgi:teichuronic acid biosynthesis glycosyltransferase TuaG